MYLSTGDKKNLATGPYCYFEVCFSCKHKETALNFRIQLKQSGLNKVANQFLYELCKK